MRLIVDRLPVLNYSTRINTVNEVEVEGQTYLNFLKRK